MSKRKLERRNSQTQKKPKTRNESSQSSPSPSPSPSPLTPSSNDTLQVINACISQWKEKHKEAEESPNSQSSQSELRRIRQFCFDLSSSEVLPFMSSLHAMSSAKASEKSIVEL